MEPLPNPEREWTPPSNTLAVDRSDIEERIGAVDQPWQVLRGGHANANIRIGEDRLLRIYRRDADSVHKEKSLLERRWTNLRVPQILGSGEDFLLLEYVPHSPVTGSRLHGEAVGCALADIHAVTFEQSGFLGPNADSVATPFRDLVVDFRNHAETREDVPDEVRKQVVSFFDDQLEKLRPFATQPVLVHGDFKASNLGWTRDELPLVLDWEFAYAGPALADIGQLFRWEPPEPFGHGFVEGYQRGDGELPGDWRRWAAGFDLVNLVGLIDGSPPDSTRFADCRRRIEQTLADW